MFELSVCLCVQAIEALMVEVEKRVRGFHRMQGQTLKGIYNRLSDFRTGGARQLKPAFLEEAHRIVDNLNNSGSLLAKAVDVLTSKDCKVCCSCCNTLACEDCGHSEQFG